MASTRYTTVGLFVLLGAIWGLSFVAARVTLPDVPPVPLAALRFDVAGVLMLGYARLTSTAWVPSRRSDWWTVVVGGLLFVALHHALLFAGQQYVTSAVAAVVICLDPILAAGFSRLLLPSEGLSLAGAVGLLLGLLGVGIVASPSPDALVRADVRGVGLVFLAAAAFALGAVLTRRMGPELPVQSMQAWMMLVGALALHAMDVVLPTGGLSRASWSWTALAGLAYLAVVAAGLGYLMYFELLDRLGPVELNLVAYATPVFAALGGWVLLGERIAAHTVAGFVVIAVGFALLKREALAATLDSLRYSS